MTAELSDRTAGLLWLFVVFGLPAFVEDPPGLGRLDDDPWSGSHGGSEHRRVWAMSGDVDRELRRRLLVALHEGELEQFEHWFASVAWDDRSQLVVEVDHLLAERADMDEVDFLAGVVATSR